MLGKRKRAGPTVVVRRQTSIESSPSSPDLEQHNHPPNDIFRKHFEAQFAPLPEPEPVSEDSDDSELDDDNSDYNEDSTKNHDTEEWTGLSEDEPSLPPVTIIEVKAHTTTASNGVDDEQAPEDPIQRIFRKQFLSSKPPRDTPLNPSLTPQTQPRHPDSKTDADEEEGEKLNLKNDLDLQRLLRESHILSDTRPSQRTPGRQKAKALDLRLQALGARTSLLAQERMPMSHRRGISEGKAQREAKRRAEARENGVVLEKLVAGTTGQRRPVRKRERGVDAPGVGSFRGGTLMLSRSDVQSIQGGGASRGGRGDGKARGRGKR